MAYGYLNQSTWLRNVLSRTRFGTGSLVFDSERRRKGGLVSDEREGRGMTPSREIQQIG